MILIAVVPLLIDAALRGMRWGIELKEERRARQSVVHGITGGLQWAAARIESLDRRVASSERQESRDPRHERWVREVAQWRAVETRLREQLPTYQRLAVHLWEPFPRRGYDRSYLDPKELKYINRYVEPQAAALWSIAGATIAVALTSLFLLALGLLARRLRRLRSSSA